MHLVVVPSIYVILLGLLMTMSAVFSHKKYPASEHNYDVCEPDQFHLRQFYSMWTNIAFFGTSMCCTVRYKFSNDPLFLQCAVTSMLICFMSWFYHGSNNAWYSGPLDITSIFWQLSVFLHVLLTGSHKFNGDALFNYAVLALGCAFYVFSSTFAAQETMLVVMVSSILAYTLRKMYRLYPHIKKASLCLGGVVLLGVPEMVLLYKGCLLGRWTHGLSHVINAVIIVLATESIFRLKLQENHMVLIRQNSSRVYFHGV